MRVGKIRPPDGEILAEMGKTREVRLGMGTTVSYGLRSPTVWHPRKIGLSEIEARAIRSVVGGDLFRSELA